MISADNIAPYVVADPARAADIALGRDVEKAAGKVEELFLNELLKVMFQNTELAKQKVVSDFLPVFTMEISKAMSERGIGLKDFFLNSPAFRLAVERGGGAKTPVQGKAEGPAPEERQSVMKLGAYERAGK